MKKIHIDKVEIGIAAFVVFFAVLGKALPSAKLFGFDIFQIHIFWISGILIGSYILFSNVVFLPRPLTYFLLLLILSILSLAQSPILFQSAKKVYGLLIAGLIVISIIHFGDSERKIEQIIYSLLIFGFGLIVISLWEIETAGQLGAITNLLENPRYFRVGSKMEITAGFVNRNPLSLTIGFISPFAIYAMLASRSLLLRFASGLLVLGISIICVVNWTRGALLIIAGSFVIIFSSIILKRSSLELQGWPRFGLFTYAGGASSYLLIPTMISFPLPESEYGSIYTRWELLQNSLGLILSNPLPSGIGTFYIRVAEQTEFGRVFTAHNWAVELAVELSIIGLVIFVLMMGYVIDQLFKFYFVNHRAGWTLPVATGLLLFSIGSLSSSGVLYGKIRVIWVLFGLGAAYITIYADVQQGSVS